MSSTRSSGELIRVGIMLSPERGLVSGALTMLIDHAPSFQLVMMRTDGSGMPVDRDAAIPDVVIVDRLSLITRLREARPGLCTIMLIGEPSLDGVLASIRAGALACIDDSTAPAELLSIVERVSAGEAVFAPNVLIELLQRQSLPAIIPLNRTAKLSDREVEVLAALARGASTAEAANEFGISLNTIRTHLKNILVKMGARSKLEAVVIALREGRISLDLPDSH